MHSSLAILLSITSLALAAPATSTLNARFSSDEIIYISYCTSGHPEDVGGIAAQYYANYAQSQNLQHPDSESNRINAPNGDVPTIEGSTLKFQFPGVVSFNSHINSNGQSLPKGQYAGDGDQLVNHKFNKKFQCFKDDGTTLYTQGDGYGYYKDCLKEYYCRAA